MGGEELDEIGHGGLGVERFKGLGVERFRAVEGISLVFHLLLAVEMITYNPYHLRIGFST
jgi:hypothetical protein